jgi:hypothetical protein
MRVEQMVEEPAVQPLASNTARWLMTWVQVLKLAEELVEAVSLSGTSALILIFVHREAPFLTIFLSPKYFSGFVVRKVLFLQLDPSDGLHNRF